MTINIIKNVQDKLGYRPLHKIDPDIAEIFPDNEIPDEDRFSQAAIPAIAIALYEYTRTDEGAENVLTIGSTDKWLMLIFHNYTSEVIEKVSIYSKVSFENSLKKMNAIADESVRLVKEQVRKEHTMLHIKELLAQQRTDALLYLPACMRAPVLLTLGLNDHTDTIQVPIRKLMQIIDIKLAIPVGKNSIQSNY